MKKDLYIYLLFLILPILFFGNHFFIDGVERVYLGSDFIHYFAGFSYYVDRLRNFSFPFWDPYAVQGVPFVERMDLGILYPINFIWAVIGALTNLKITSLYIWYELYALFHLSLVGIFTYWLAKEFGISKFGAVLSGIIYMFSGTLILMLNALPIITSAIWLPLIIIYFKRGLEHRGRQKATNFFIASLFIALSHYAGYFQVSFYYNGLFILLYYIYWCFTQDEYKKREIIENTFGLCLVFALSLLLYAFQLLPSLELMNLSSRSMNTFNTATMYGPIEPIWVTNFIVPNVFRYIDDLGIMNYFEVYYYIGIFPLMLALYAFFVSKHRFVKFLAFCLVFFLFASFGGFSSLYEYIVLYVPKLDQTRNVFKIQYLVGLSLSVAAGFGYDFLHQDADIKKIGKFIIYFILLSFGLIIINYQLFNVVDFIRDLANAKSYFNSVIVFVLLLLSSIYLFYKISSNENGNLTKILIIGLVILDLSILNKYIPGNNFRQNPSDIFGPVGKEFVNIIKNDSEQFRVIFKGYIYGIQYVPEITQIQNAGGYLSLALKTSSDNINNLDKYDINSIEYASKLNDLGVKYVVSSILIYNPSLTLIKDVTVGTGDNYYTYEDRRGIYKKSLGQKEYVYLNRLFNGVIDMKGSYKINKYTPDLINIDTSTVDEANFQIKISAFPNWHVYLNYSEIDYYVDSLGYINFRLPPGNSNVQLKYEPKRLYIGFLISLISFLFAILLIRYLPYEKRYN